MLVGILYIGIRPYGFLVVSISCMGPFGSVFIHGPGGGHLNVGVGKRVCAQKNVGVCGGTPYRHGGMHGGAGRSFFPFWVIN